MIVPRFKKDYKGKTIQELIIERQKIMKEMSNIEEELFLTTKKVENEMMMEPSPEVFWSVMNDDLIMITTLIIEKIKE